jgi:hypothetical protein
MAKLILFRYIWTISVFIAFVAGILHPCDFSQLDTCVRYANQLGLIHQIIGRFLIGVIEAVVIGVIMIVLLQGLSKILGCVMNIDLDFV